MPTFAQNYIEGDVVYGISQSRAPYINSLPGGDADTARTNGSYIICDEFNNRTFLGLSSQPLGTTSDHTQFESTEKSPTTLDEVLYNVDFYQHGRGLAQLSQTQKNAVSDYYDALSQDRRSPEQAFKDAPKKRQKNNDTVTMFAIRRACKFGLEYNIMTRMNTVHFALDIPFNPGTNMDNQHIVDKTKYSGAGPSNAPAAQVPVTFSELRCCYRYRNQWMPTGRLKFYSNLDEVNAPWVTHPGIWHEYETYRTVKAYKKKHPVKYKFGWRP